MPTLMGSWDARTTTALREARVAMTGPRDWSFIIVGFVFGVGVCLQVLFEG
jgi:hypothetical protein